MCSRVVFHETYHADGPDFNNAYRTFTFDTATGRRLQLADLVKPGLDPLVAIPPLAEPFIVAALDAAPPPHQPGSYPFVADRWTPDKVYSGGYRAWALTPGELILYHAGLSGGPRHPNRFHPGDHAMVDGRRHRAGAHPTRRSRCDTAPRVPSRVSYRQLQRSIARRLPAGRPRQNNRST